MFQHQLLINKSFESWAWENLSTRSLQTFKSCFLYDNAKHHFRVSVWHFASPFRWYLLTKHRTYQIKKVCLTTPRERKRKSQMSTSIFPFSFSIFCVEKVEIGKIWSCTDWKNWTPNSIWMARKWEIIARNDICSLPQARGSGENAVHFRPSN